METEQRRVALVIVDHGSRNEASNRTLDDVVRHVSEISGDRYAAVLAAHMDLAEPSIADAFEAAVAVGAEFVVVALYFLAPGRHSETDVPKLAAEAAARHGIAFAITGSLGPDTAVSAIVLERVTEALRSTRK